MKTLRIRFAFQLMVLILSGPQGFARGAGQDAARNQDVVHPDTPPAIRVVFFTPSDLTMPAGARERLTRIADVTEQYFFKEMKRWGYPAAAKSLFRYEKDGQVEVLNVRGDLPVSSGKYDKPTYANDVIQQATSQYHVPGTNHVWWIFIYLGDRPKRFEDFRGSGDPREGGRAMVNYDSVPGEIRSDLGLAEGFNGEYFLKGTIHELGHAFGLHHTGPDITLGLGNSLMGPATVVYVGRKGSKPEQVYLNESSAAMLWKHPIFSGKTMDAVQLPSVKLVDYRPVFNASNDTVTICGRLISDQHAHSVVLIDDLGRPRDQYWVQSHTARIDSDGTFQIKINKPAKVNGHYRILFCFENGLVTGDGTHVTFDDRGDIRKSYSFRDGDFQFGE